MRNGQQVGPPHGKRIEAERARHGVEHGLEGVTHIDRTVAAHGPVRRRVGVQPDTEVAARRQVVHGMQQRPGIENRDQAIAGISTAALHHLAIHCGDGAAAGQADSEPHIGLRAPAVRDEALLAREFELHGGTGRAGQQAGDDLEVERFSAVPETATDKRFDHPDLRSVQPQALGQDQMHVVGHLRHRVQGQTPTLGVPTGQRNVGLHHGVGDFGVVETLFQHQVGGGKTAWHIAEAVVHVAHDVAGLVLVQQHRVAGTRAGGIKVGRQGLQIERDGGQRGAGRGHVNGGHGGNRFAAVTHAFSGQRILVLGDRNDAIGHITLVSRDDSMHARYGPRATDVNAANPGMG